MSQEWMLALQARLLQKKVETLTVSRDEARHLADSALRELAAGKLAAGSHLTREEVAAHLGVSTRTIQRMELAGTLSRCPGMGAVVRYAARDVLRLASAPRKER
jgi:DNA-binding GntR family transcriptional regulator